MSNIKIRQWHVIMEACCVYITVILNILLNDSCRCEEVSTNASTEDKNSTSTKLEIDTVSMREDQMGMNQPMMLNHF